MSGFGWKECWRCGETVTHDLEGGRGSPAPAQCSSCGVWVIAPDPLLLYVIRSDASPRIGTSFEEPTDDVLADASEGDGASFDVCVARLPPSILALFRHLEQSGLDEVPLGAEVLRPALASAFTCGWTAYGETVGEEVLPPRALVRAIEAAGDFPEAASLEEAEAEQLRSDPVVAGTEVLRDVVRIAFIGGWKSARAART
jgi:hypothetical protein